MSIIVVWDTIQDVRSENNSVARSFQKFLHTTFFSSIYFSSHFNRDSDARLIKWTVSVIRN